MARVKCPKCFTVNPDGQERCVQCSAPLPRIRIAGPSASAPKAPPPGQPGVLPAQLNPGQTLAGRYTILQLIGRGGMGCIYRVRDNTLNEEVALKTLLPQFVRDKMVVERFFNEARIARKLAHPNIVRVHDIGSAEGMVYISMELVRGQSLRNHMERLPSGQRLPPRDVLRVAEDLCVALEYAHQYTVHRDIKPENIMVDEKGVVKLMDFGISKLMANTRMTGASVVMGTPFYMSPEQLRNSRDVDARADIFSVGVVLYEILTGSVPTGVPKPPSVVIPTLPKRLDEIVGKCVEPDPGKRYQNAGELRADLLAVRQEMEQGNAVPKAVPRRSTLSLPSDLIGWAVSAVCLIATIGAVYAIETGQKNATPSQSSAAAGAGSEAGDMTALVERLRVAAQAVSGADVPAILEDAERYWTAATESGDTAALENALRGYAAVLMLASSPGMAYVPAGIAITPAGREDVPAFFVDRLETTYGEFAKFCKDKEWRSSYTVMDEFANLPVGNVAYYDAQAFAASLGKRLPTNAQWTRAAKLNETTRLYPWEGDFSADQCVCDEEEPASVFEEIPDTNAIGCKNLVGNVSEWTRSPRGGEGPPTFGDQVEVRGGSYESGDATLDTTSYVAYGAFRESIGFRCVKEIPTDKARIEALLNRGG